MVYAIGIDLGTTNSCMAVWRDNRAEVIPSDLNYRTIPSAVGFNNNPNPIVGEHAKAAFAANSANTVTQFKRLIGRRFDDIAVTDLLKHLSYQIVNIEGQPRIKVRHNGQDMVYSPEEVSSFLLRELKRRASEFLNQEVTKAVITVPAYFTNYQRSFTRRAGELAGLEVLQIVNEPTAAALAYTSSLGLNTSWPRTVLIFDLGGGTFDVTLLKANADGNIDVCVKDGDGSLGGTDFTNRLVSTVIARFEEEHDIYISDNRKAIRRITTECERAKCLFTASSHANINIENLIGDQDLRQEISRDDFNEMCQDLFDRTLSIVIKVLDEADMVPTDIDDVVLVGGSSRVKSIQDMIGDYFPSERIRKTVNPDEVVASGAALLADQLANPKPSGFHGRTKSYTLNDITQFPLGINVADGKLSTIIPKFTKIPTQETLQYCTSIDNQRGLDFIILEGESEESENNTVLGKVQLGGFPALPAGRVGVDLTFQVDTDGILTVKASQKNNPSNFTSAVFSNIRPDPNQYRHEIELSERTRKLSMAEDADAMSLQSYYSNTLTTTNSSVSSQTTTALIQSPTDSYASQIESMKKTINLTNEQSTELEEISNSFRSSSSEVRQKFNRALLKFAIQNLRKKSYGKKTSKQSRSRMQDLANNTEVWLIENYYTCTVLELEKRTKEVVDLYNQVFESKLFFKSSSNSNL